MPTGILSRSPTASPRVVRGRWAYRGVGATTTAPATLGPQMCANPLPAGRYAIQIFDNPVGAVRAFGVWADYYGVTIEASKPIPQSATGANDGLAAIFSVGSPVLWNQTIWGCPNVADKSVNISNFAPDTPPGSVWQELFGGSGSSLFSVPTWVYFAGGAVLLLALAPTMFEVSKIAAVHEEHKDGAG